MRKNVPQPDVAALGIVVTALDSLDEQQRLWVLETAASRFSLKVGTAGSGTDAPAGGTGTAAAHGSKDTSPKSFMRTKNPNTDVQRITCLAFYLTRFRDTPHFKTGQLTQLNTDAARPKLANPTVAVGNATKAGYLTPAGKGNKQLTTLGEDLAEALPDQEKVKLLVSQNRGRKKKARKKK